MWSIMDVSKIRLNLNWDQIPMALIHVLRVRGIRVYIIQYNTRVTIS